MPYTDNSIYADVSVILREMQKRCIQLVPLYEYFPFRLLPSQTHFAQANDKIHRIVRRLLKERREAITTADSASGERRKYLLDVLIEGQENSGFPDTVRQSPFSRGADSRLRPGGATRLLMLDL